MRARSIIIFMVFLCTGRCYAGEVTLSAAASLRDAVAELSAGFTKMNPGVVILRNFGASGALAKQIENGVPADIFISANPEWVEYLKERKLVDAASIGTFAYNTLVFAGAPEKKADSMKDLAMLEKIAIGSPRSVPAGEYAMEAIRRAGMGRQLEKKLVMARDVRECLMYAERGEVDGAFVYRTDALQAKRTKILFTVPRELYPRVTYPMVLTLKGAKSRDAAALYRYLQSHDAKRVAEKYGFVLK